MNGWPTAESGEAMTDERLAEIKRMAASSWPRLWAAWWALPELIEEIERLREAARRLR